VHRRTAAEVAGIAPAAVTAEQRARAKAVNFGIIYGSSAFGLANQLGIASAEAQATIDCQVCVPASWSDAEVIAFTERVSPSGTSNGWKIRRTGDPGLGGDPERNPCADRNTFIHMILDA